MFFNQLQVKTDLKNLTTLPMIAQRLILIKLFTSLQKLSFQNRKCVIAYYSLL